MLTTTKHSHVKGSEGLEGSFREVNRRRATAARTGIGDNNIDGLALPRDPDRLAAVRGLDTGVAIGTVIEGGDQVIVRVNRATGTSDTTLGEPCETKQG